MEENRLRNNWKIYLIPITLIMLLIDLGLTIAVIAKIGNFIVF